MAPLSGILHRPLAAAAAATAVATAAFSSEFPNRFTCAEVSDTTSAKTASSDRLHGLSKEQGSWVSWISVSGLSNNLLGAQKHVTDTIPNLGLPSMLNPMSSSFSSPAASLPVIHTLYQYAKLAKLTQSTKFTPIPSSPSEILYRWHLPDPNCHGMFDDSGCATAVKSQTVVVLLGWLGAKQKHLKRYADWYTSRGFHVITFTFPMADILSYRVGGTAEQNLDLLANHLAGWVAEESGKNMVFHTFSNTGWLTYGVILEKFQNQDPSLMGRIKGCVVDSAPVATPDPQVWASGFSAAFLKKQSVATKGMVDSNNPRTGALVGSVSKPAVTEVALLAVLGKFFEVVLNLPSVSRRLSDVLELLSTKQPKCPQLYIYSSSDRVIPAKSVESFIEGQRRSGHEVRACDFVSSPHVDHFRNNPRLYTSQLTTFLEDNVLTCSQDSSK